MYTNINSKLIVHITIKKKKKWVRISNVKYKFQLMYIQIQRRPHENVTTQNQYCNHKKIVPT